MKNLYLFFILLSSLYANLTGTWFDEKNNQIQITIKNKVVTGKYTKVENDRKEIFDIKGVANGDQISFCVIFEKEKSIQSWIGQHTKKNKIEKIITLWHRNKDVIDVEEKENLWSSIFHGKNIFTRKKSSEIAKKIIEKIDFSGLWRNHRGSEMQLTISDNGYISGIYKTAVGEPNFKQKFPITGFTIGDQITFCVRFEKWNSATAWVGKYEQGSIVTLWHLGIGGDFTSLISGYSSFERVHVKKSTHK